ncbi:TetR family transcriptional regulator [Streptomyces bathyalis]|uniref:TetR family transcriptional regulator n=1 Tax=Streptomyces bathyalis TaxID=2710756 RepID=A0A7T1T687_9ACTN|nr:TetR/AcrR family transcriptional regulator [Streptomyces bathyalis]QPP07128.1 TetR family transcriptional regulator [Streptomyces bathyalis]
MAGRRPGGKGPSRIERERRAQLTRTTIDLVTEHGYAAASLARIAQAAGVTKGTVVYHFATKDAVLEAAYQQVLNELVADVGQAVDAVTAEQAPAAYVRRMVGHFAEHPKHARMIVESRLHQVSKDEDTPAGATGPARAERRQPLAALLTEARGDRSRAEGRDMRTLAVLVGGMIDAVVAEGLDDPTYDMQAAAETIVQMLEAELF